MPLPVVFGVVTPEPCALGLPGAVAPGLPPAPPVCANAAVVISTADTIATGIRILADMFRLLASGVSPAPSSSRRKLPDCSGGGAGRHTSTPHPGDEKQAAGQQSRTETG